jgi:type I restriction enzyme, S subunit
MRRDWVTATLDELCFFTSGLWKGEKPPFINVGVIRNTNFTPAGYLDDSEIAFLDVEEAQYAKRQLQVGDIILEKSGGGPKQPVGRVILFEKVGGHYSFSNFTAAIRVKDTKLLDYRFLHKLLHYYYTSGRTEPLQRHSTGIRNLQLTAYKSLEIALPSLAEQKRIVAILDEAFAGIDAAVANAGKNIANARELFESYLNSVFSRKGDDWVEVRLSECISIKHGYAFKGHEFNRDSDINKPIVLTPGNYTTDGRLCFTSSNTKRLTGAVPPDYVFEVGELTVVMTDLSSKMKILGQPAFIDRANILHNQRIGRIAFKTDGLTPKLLYYFLRTRSVSERIKKTSTGTMVRHTAPERILANVISFPRPEDEQCEVIAGLEAIEQKTKELELVYHTELTALAELKQSILQKAFAGELTAKEAERELAAA